MTKQIETNVKLFIALISLFGLLAYTFVHTGALLARYVRPSFVGYMAAFSVEIAIAGLTWRLARKKTKRVFLLFALIAALTISALANVYEGHAERYQTELTIDNITQIDPIQAIIGLSATGLLSLLVFAISEIIGDDVVIVTRQTESKQKKEEAKQKDEQKPNNDEQTPNIVEQIDYKLLIYAALTNESIDGVGVRSSGQVFGVNEMSRQIECSPATASKWMNDYYKNGK